MILLFQSLKNCCHRCSSSLKSIQSLVNIRISSYLLLSRLIIGHYCQGIFSSVIISTYMQLSLVRSFAIFLTWDSWSHFLFSHVFLSHSELFSITHMISHFLIVWAYTFYINLCILYTYFVSLFYFFFNFPETGIRILNLVVFFLFRNSLGAI